MTAPARIARRAALAALAAGAVLSAPAMARVLTLVESHPAVEEVISGSAVAFALRFDHPVDHASGEMTLVWPQGTRAIRPLLDSAPDVLYGMAGDLAPGRYELRWRVRAAEGGEDRTSGTIGFRVR